MSPKFTNATLTADEFIVDTVTLAGPDCIGCQKTGTDLMLTGFVKEHPKRLGGPVFIDLFMTRAAAFELRDALNKALAV